MEYEHELGEDVEIADEVCLNGAFVLMFGIAIGFFVGILLGAIVGGLIVRFLI